MKKKNEAESNIELFAAILNASDVASPTLKNAILKGTLLALQAPDSESGVYVVPSALESLLQLYSTSGNTGTSSYVRENDMFFPFIGKTVLIRGGIFSYLAKIIDVSQNEILATNVCWLADTGDFEPLVSAQGGQHLTTIVSNARPQYYIADSKVILMKSILSDVLEWHGTYQKK